MKANAVLLVVAFTFVMATSPLARGEDPTAKPPADLKKALAELEKDFKAIDAKARKEKAERLEKTVKQLQDLQDSYTKASKLDEAVAVRDMLKQLKEEGVHLILGAKVLDDPGSVSGYRGKNDEVFYFKVTGTTDGTVWGSGVYTDDSRLSTAAVHAGALKAGETGIVKVTIVEGQGAYEGSTENEVTTNGYGPWQGSFKVEAVKAEKK
jgi:predicted HTH domain antitoxin